jgi:small subunit ribosomal protein S17
MTEQQPTDAAPASTEPDEQLPPKERRKRDRARHQGTARAPRDPAERASERAEQRRLKAAARRRGRQRERERRRSDDRPRGPAKTQPVVAEGRGRPRERQGVVISDRGDKTISVRIDAARRHRTYQKIVRSSSTLYAHDEGNEANAGDTVRVVESRPLSRKKRWRLIAVLERAR